jgi:uncharacterized repeat protein (TIGR01451 family)
MPAHRRILKHCSKIASAPRVFFFFCLFSTFFFLSSENVYAWPTSAQWIPIFKGGALLQDDTGDTQGSRNIVSDATNPAAFVFNDGQYIYFRLRLDVSPAGTGGQGYLQAYGWGVEFDSNLNAPDYEWLLMLDGIAKEEKVELWHNTVQGTLGDPGDKSEILTASVPLLGNYQISAADTSINGDQDYFLDWRFPYDTLKQVTGITDSSPLRFFFGSSSSASSLTEKGADLVGASDLYSGFSDYVSPFGIRPTTGTIHFVQNLEGTGEVAAVCAGETLYLRADDGDRNYNPTGLNTVPATLSVLSGDNETVTLTETGINTGIFTGSIASAAGAPANEDGLFQVMPGETVTVTFIDTIDGSIPPLQNQPRTDTLVINPPVISVTKTVSAEFANAGETITYTITIENAACGEAWLTYLSDVIPDGFTYVPGSTTGFITADPIVTGQQLTWNGAWTVPPYSTITLSLSVTAGGVAGTFYDTASLSGPNVSLLSTGPTAPVTVTAPLISLNKAVDKGAAGPGEELIYSVHYRNTGNGAAQALFIVDTVPLHTTFVAGSLQRGAAGSNYGDPANTVFTDSDGDSDGGAITGETITFIINSIEPDDGIPDSGADEGKVFFKVRIN